MEIFFEEIASLKVEIADLNTQIRKVESDIEKCKDPMKEEHLRRREEHLRTELRTEKEQLRNLVLAKTQNQPPHLESNRKSSGTGARSRGSANHAMELMTKCNKYISDKSIKFHLGNREQANILIDPSLNFPFITKNDILNLLGIRWTKKKKTNNMMITGDNEDDLQSGSQTGHMH
jgi:hypothetical protein